MKRRDVLFGCAVVLLSLGAPRAYTAQAPSIERATAALSDGNLLQDPSFENTPLGPIGVADMPWGAEEPGAVEIVQGTGPAGPGAKFAQLNASAGAQLFQVFAVEPSTDYRVSLWITGTPGAGAGGTARVHIADLSGIDEDADGDSGIDGSTSLVTVSFDGETGVWRQVTFTFNAGAYSRLHIRFNAELTPGESLWVDDVRITKASVGGLTLSLNQPTFQTGDQLILNAQVIPGPTPVTADVYIALQLPGCTSSACLLFWQGGSNFTPTPQPLLRNWPISAFPGPIFTYTFGGTEPVGGYVWLGAFVVPGTGTLIGGITQAPFTFSP